VLGLLGTGASVLFLSWTFTFGGLGALVARAAGRSPAVGFLLGFLLGPVGWLLVLPHKGAFDDARRQLPTVAREARARAEDGIQHADAARRWSTDVARRGSTGIAGRLRRRRGGRLPPADEGRP
jgi:hypothetical protein